MRAKFRQSFIAFLLIISMLLVPVNAMAAQVDTAAAGEADFKLGDVDNDGTVTILDATAIQRFLAQLSVQSYNEAAADTDSSGDVDITDATRIQRFVAAMCNIDGSPLDTHTHTPAAPVSENEVPATCLKEGSYDEVVYCGVCNAEISRTKKEIDIDKNAHTLTHVNEVPATTTNTGTKAHYKCSACKKLFSDKDGKNEVTAASLVIPKITQVDPKTCSHHWVKYVIPYNYDDLYVNHRSEIPFTNDSTRNTLGQNNMGALANNTGWAIYYCDKCHIADYDRFYTNQEFGRTQKEEEELSLQYVNDLRESLGLEPMYLNSYTTAVAQERAKELLTNFSHDGVRNGTTENIATCSGGAQRAFKLWKESPGHYRAMTRIGYWYFGYAYAVVPAKTNAHWRLVMVQVFAMIDF